MGALGGRTVLLVIGGGIAAYKGLETIRALMKRGARVVPVLTSGAEAFVTPLSAAALAGETAHTELLDLTAEARMGHIELSRAADLIVAAPATANLMARMAQGLADDLATTLLLATDTRILLAPAMNVRMWLHPATQRNRATLEADGVRLIGPDVGDMACGEHGPGRMAEPDAIADAAERLILAGSQKIPLAGGHEHEGSGFGGEALDEASDARFRPPRTSNDLAGRRAIVTAGPTHEPIDPVRYIANRSSGRQGYEIARELAERGADVTLVSGPVHLSDPAGVRVVRVETAREMLAAVEAALPADIAVFAAAVADWRSREIASSKMKKVADHAPAPLELVRNPDILATIAKSPNRPRLVVGFAAETDDVLAHAKAKLERKGADWIVANDVSEASGVAGGVMGGPRNRIVLLKRTLEGGSTSVAFPEMEKSEVALHLGSQIAEALENADEADSPDTPS